MKNFLLVILFLGFIIPTFAQVGNFRSITTGTWSTPGTWERDADMNGSYEESPATVTPNSTSGTIEIQAGHIVTVNSSVVIDETTVQSTAAIILNDGSQFSPIELTVNDGIGDDLIVDGSLTLDDAFGFVGTNLNNNGTIVNSGSIVVTTPAISFVNMNAESVYNHNQNGGSIPLSVWDASSVCTVTGVTTTIPNNIGQAFGNLTWNNPSQNGGLSLGISGSNTSVAGDFQIQSTGGQLFFLTTTESGVSVDIANNFIITGASFVVFTNSGSINFNVGEDFSYSSVTPSFFTSTGTATVNLSGNFAHVSGSLGVTGAGVGLVNFEGSSVQTFTDGGTFTNIDFLVSSNSILDLGVSSLTGSGEFMLSNLAQLSVGSTEAGGAIQNGTTAGNIRVSGIRTYEDGSTIVYNGAAAQFIGSSHPDNVHTTINNINGVSLASSVAINGDLLLETGNLSVGANQLTLGGGFSVSTGAVAVAPTSDILIEGTGAFGTFPFASASPTLNDFTFNRSGEAVAFEDDVTITGVLTLGGDIDFTGQTLNLSGTISGTGNFWANAGSTLNITGSGAFGALQFDPSGNTLGTLSINRPSSGTITLQGSLIIGSALTLVNGTFDNSASLFMSDGSLLTKNSNALFNGDSPETTGGDFYNLLYTNAGATTGSEVPAAAVTNALGDLTIQTSGPVVLDQDLQVNGDVILENGPFSIGTQTLTVLGNWERNGGALASYTGQVIFAGNTTILGTNTATFGNIRVTDVASMTFPPDNINFTNDIQIDAGATFDANGSTVVVNGSATQSLGTGGVSFNNITVNKSGGAVNLTSALNLEGALDIQTATAFNSAGNLTLISTSDGPSGNGSIGELPIGGSVNGDVIIERYIAGEGRVWRYLSSPVTNATVADWQDDFPITGDFDDASTIPGVDSDPSLYYFNESLGGTFNDRYVAYPSSGTAASNPLIPGRGYVAYIREEANPTTVVVAGPVNQGEVDLSVTYTSSGDPSDGYNLVGNPYPSTIDWDNNSAWTKTNIDGMIAVRDNPSGTFRYWNGSTGDLAGGLIATGQSFWIRTSASSPSLIATEGVKAGTGTTGSFYREQDVLENELIISLTDGSRTDKTFLAIFPGSTAGFDNEYDALKLDNDIFDISTFDTDSNRLAINFFPEFGCNKEVGIDIADAEEGSYTLEFSSLENFSIAYDIVLHDTYLSTTTNIAETAVYDFEVTDAPETSGASRFKLEFSIDLIDKDIIISSSQVLCEKEDAVATLETSQSGTTYQVFLGSEVLSSEVGTGEELLLNIPGDSLSVGENVIKVQASLEGCSSEYVGEDVVITKAILEPEISTNDEGQLVSNFDEGNQWYLNDELISGATQQVYTPTNSGTYTLEVTSEGCSARTNLEFSITGLENNEFGSALQLFPNPVKNKLLINSESARITKIEIYNSVGNKIHDIELNSKEYVFNSRPLPEGMYIIRVKSEENVSFKRFIKK